MLQTEQGSQGAVKLVTAGTKIQIHLLWVEVGQLPALHLLFRKLLFREFGTY